MQRCWAARAADRPTFAQVKGLLFEEVKSEREGECCICLERLAKHNLLALVPCGHRCVCAQHAAELVGGGCPVCRTEAKDAIRVYN
jgi:hypothetical protein